MTNEKQNKKVRILYVENGIGYGGAIICLRHLVRNLDHSKYSPYVVTSRTGPDYKQIATEARWKYIKDRFFDSNKLKMKIEKKDLFKSNPILSLVVNQILSRSDDIINFLPFFFRILKVVNEFNPNLIHVNNEPVCNRAAIFAGKMKNIPVICHVRGNQKGSAMLKWLYQLPDHFIPVSNWVSENIGRLGIPKDKRTVIYDGISFDSLNLEADGNNFRNRFKIKPDDFVVGLVGMMIPWKGQDDFIDAANILKSQIPNLRMMIIGSAPDEFKWYETHLKKRVKNEGLNHVVVFTGHQTKMDTIYNGLEVVVSASSSPEPLGTMVIETMIMGRPLIVPSHGGGAEMTKADKTGLLFKPGDSQDLARVILKYFKNPELRIKLGAAARKTALKTFAVEEHVKNVQTIYDLYLLR